MANDSLEHEARTRQSRSENPDTLRNKTSRSEALSDIPREPQFSLTLAASEWRLFWRLLNVGSMLSDQILALESHPTLNPEIDAALLWNRLASELAPLLGGSSLQSSSGGSG